MNFSVWSAPTNGQQIATSINLAPVSVSNGLFAVTLDFGPGVFNGGAQWLEIDVATNGGQAVALTPREQFTPTPYAIMAESASNLVGAISSGQLPASVLTNNDPGVIFPGLTLNGPLTLPSTGSSPDRIFSGGGLLLDADANGNLFLGQPAGNLVLTGMQNTGEGMDTLINDSTGTGNTASGYQSMQFNTTGVYNTAVGLRSLYSGTSGTYNTGLGLRALYSNNVSSFNTGAGALTLYNNVNGSNNIAVGFGAGSNILGSSNIDIGNAGASADNNIIRIGTGQTQAFIAGAINGNGAGLTNLAASNLVGALGPGQLPAGLITNGAGGVALNGAFSGNGGGLTNLTTSNLIGLLTLAQLPPGLITNGNGGVTLAGTFGGDGSGLTNLAASNLNGALAFGQLPPGVLVNNSTNVNLAGNFSGNGAGLANVAASNLSGALSLAQLPGGIITNSNTALVYLTGAFSGDGSGLTNLAASNINGAIAPGQLPAGVLVNNSTNVTLTGSFSGSGAGLSNLAVWQLSSGVSIGAASGNWISSNGAAYGFIGGGLGNSIVSGAAEAFIGGGDFNTNGGNYAAIAGGSDNLTAGNNATVPGGYNNQALGNGSFAAGQFATASNNGSFVWGDGTRAVSDPASNTFVASATGGFYFETSGTSKVSIATNGALSAPVLTITGGSDVAEPFQISGETIEAGVVVIIDDQHPGHLKLSDRPYDTRVAGVISGANGIHPGIQMQQQGLLEGGQNVALTGRVYVRAETSNGAIRPGDLLTTSALPGYAMKVTDHQRAQGAILGKAMTGLSQDKGMVLVLVTLQ